MAHYDYVSMGIVAGMFVLTAIGGFIVLPDAEPELKFAGLWDAICSRRRSFPNRAS